MRGPTLRRRSFVTSRLLDFFSEKELVAQTGHAVSHWPAVVLKELVDNALDGCEDADTAPEIEVIVGADHITVRDNARGIPQEVVGSMLDYSVRVSSREAYVAPDRGAQGNALKTIVAMPFVLDGTNGRIDIRARSVRHEIETRVDRIRQQPVIDHQKEVAPAKNGTSVTVHWPDSACSILDRAESQFLQIARAFACLNPHLDLSLSWRGTNHEWHPTQAEWTKWRPGNPTCAHWYRPVVFMLHAACPRVTYSDRGKSAVVLGG